MTMPEQLPGNDLPGMWEHADFMGGREVVRGPSPTIRLELTPAEASVVLTALDHHRHFRGGQPYERVANVRTRLRNALADVVQEMRV